MVALSRNVAPKHAMEMLLLGELADAETAYRIGLVNRVVEPGGALAAAQALARKAASKSIHVLAIGKKAFYAQREMSLAEAYDYTVDVMVQNMLARDAEEGIGAFVEKREPQWRDC
jgi:enoyl-CoA hydratase/carnithine racemase